MKCTLDKKEGLLRSLKVDIPATMVQEAFDKVYKGIQKNATIKGFRKGKAPIQAIRSMYGDRVQQDVIEELVQENYSRALSEHSLDPVGYPRLNVGRLTEESDFSFTAEFEVRPEVQIAKLEGLPLQKEKLVISEAAIDEVLENLRQSRAENVTVFEDRAAAKGDVVKIDFEGFVDGLPLEGGSAQDHLLELGSSRFIPGFEEELEGMRPSQTRELNLTFPAEYHNAEIAGKPVLFKVTLKELLKKSLPELNDAFAQQVGPYKSVDELKDAVRNDILSREEKRVREELSQRALKSLVQANPVEIPSGLKMEQKAELIEDTRKNLEKQGLNHIDFEEYKKKWDSEFDQTASEMIHTSFLIDAVASKLNLWANQKDVLDWIEQQAQSIGLEPDRMRKFYEESGRLSQLRFQITQDRVVDHIIKTAEITEVDKDKLADAQ